MLFPLSGKGLEMVVVVDSAKLWRNEPIRTYSGCNPVPIFPSVSPVIHKEIRICMGHAWDCTARFVEWTQVTDLVYCYWFGCIQKSAISDVGPSDVTRLSSGRKDLVMEWSSSASQKGTFAFLTYWLGGT